MNTPIKYASGEKFFGCTYIQDEGTAIGVHQDRRLAKFLCHCGKEFIAVLEYVKFGKRKSCGCLKKNNSFTPMPEYDDTVIKTFWSRAELTANPDKCWNWTNGKDRDGYGSFNIGYDNLRAHRFAYYLHNKVDPKELQVCHTCDNPSCVNPNHLFLGTTQDNTKDRDLKGRHNPARGDKQGSRTKPETRPRGKDHWNYKYTEAIVKEIFEMYESGGYKMREIAEKIGCRKQTISNLYRQDRWQYLSKLKNNTCQ